MAADYSPERVAHITGLPVADIERFANEYGRSQELFGGPAFIRINYGMQRHGGGAMAVRTVCCLPAITGDWRHTGGGAMLSTSKLFPFDDAFLTRPDLIPSGTRTVNMTKLAKVFLLAMTSVAFAEPRLNAAFVRCRISSRRARPGALRTDRQPNTSAPSRTGRCVSRNGHAGFSRLSQPDRACRAEPGHVWGCLAQHPSRSHARRS